MMRDDSRFRVGQTVESSCCQWKGPKVLGGWKSNHFKSRDGVARLNFNTRLEASYFSMFTTCEDIAVLPWQTYDGPHISKCGFQNPA
jgi:hypothetical protein